MARDVRVPESSEWRATLRASGGFAVAAPQIEHTSSLSPIMELMSARWLRPVVAACAVVAATLLAGCGSGSSTSAAPPPSQPPAATLAVTSFTPASAGVGDVVTVTGTGFSGVTAVKVGGVTATFVVDSTTQLRVTVPAGAASGRIEIDTAAGAALSSGNLSVVAVPAVTSVSPSSIAPPARITVSGSDLDLVTQARLGGTLLAIATQSATSLALDVPAGASTGFLTLTSNGVARQSAAQVTVAGSITVASFSPTTLARGATLTITGTNLDRATGVEYTGGASSTIASRTGSTQVTTVVPSTAATGPITVVGNAGDRFTSSANLTVTIPITVDANATYRIAAGASVTVAGQGLLAVTGVTVGASAGTITTKTDTQLVFTPPAGLACGAITLVSAAQPSVAAGSVIVGNGCTVRAAGIEFAQVLSQQPGDPYQRIVPGKELLVRAYVVAENAGTAAPAVRLTAFSGSTTLGNVTMTGPATLPVLAAGAAVPDTMLYNELQSFNASLPAAWVASGLAVRVDVDPNQVVGPTVTATATPLVGTNTTIDIVLVPVVSGANVPTMPDPVLVLDELTRRMPVQRGRITVSVRAPYTLTAATDGVDTEWSAALSELEQLRRSEAPSKQYYGMVKPMVSAGTAGIGYVNRVGSSSPSLSALGWDASRSAWRRTMTHELGHNYSRSHAPCGGPANPDPNYPYANAALSATPLFESLLDDIQSPGGLTDVMAYCSGSWFSDYNYREVQRFLEARPQAAALVASVANNTAAGGESVLIAGRIDADGVSFEPAQRLRGVAVPAAAGADLLRVRTQDGATFDYPFDAIDVDHVDEQQFFVTVPATAAPIVQVDVVRAGRVLPLHGASRVTTAGAATVRGAPAIQWQETGTRLALHWDASATRFVSVTHVLAGVRTTLALHLAGGQADLDLSALPRGGELEFSLSNGFDATLVVVPR